MITFDQARLTLYPNIARTVEDKAFDANGEIVDCDKEAIEKYIESKKYIYQRLAEYPSIYDYIDGVVKGDQEQINVYIAACLAVKAKYPKPNE